MLVGQFEVLFKNVVPLFRRRSSDFLTGPSDRPSFKKSTLIWKIKSSLFLQCDDGILCEIMPKQQFEECAWIISTKTNKQTKHPVCKGLYCNRWLVVLGTYGTDCCCIFNALIIKRPMKLNNSFKSLVKPNIQKILEDKCLNRSLFWNRLQDLSPFNISKWPENLICHKLNHFCVTATM